MQVGNWFRITVDVQQPVRTFVLLSFGCWVLGVLVDIQPHARDALLKPTSDPTPCVLAARVDIQTPTR